MLYKPALAEKVHLSLQKKFGKIEKLLSCCKHVPPVPPGTELINTCPGCDRRFRENYPDTANISLWEVFAENEIMQLPDYKGRKMTILDACPARDQARIHTAVRKLAEKMNISLVEPKKTKSNSTCCGDSFFGSIPTDQVVMQMKKKAAEMPEYDVIVYCVSCVKSMFVGDRRPRYLVDLLFSEETVPRTFEPDQWHQELDEYIETHK